VGTAVTRAPEMLATLIAQRAHDLPATAGAGTKGARRDTATTSPAGDEAPAVTAVAVTPALRREPRVTTVEPPAAQAGDVVQITGSGFGTAQGRVRFGGRPAEITSGGKSGAPWTPKRIRARVPAGTITGLLTVECGTPTSPQVLAVQQNPVARVRAIATATTGVYRLDSAGSQDADGRLAAYRWQVNGAVVAHAATARARLEFRAGRARVTLSVTDDDGNTATARLVVRRPPGGGPRESAEGVSG
jgi:IPT/TIG domain